MCSWRHVALYLNAEVAARTEIGGACRKDADPSTGIHRTGASGHGTDCADPIKNGPVANGYGASDRAGHVQRTGRHRRAAAVVVRRGERYRAHALLHDAPTAA